MDDSLWKMIEGSCADTMQKGRRIYILLELQIRNIE